jgi:hypothetical protein
MWNDDISTLHENKNPGYFQHKSCRNSEMQIVTAQIGAFSINNKILIVSMNSPFTNVETDTEGAFAKVHKLAIGDQKFVIKAHFFPPGQGLKIIRSAVQEYSITKLSSLLECGPAVGKYIGFDLIIFDNSVEFAMEECQPIEKIT